jgi:hypothetical protein
MKYYIGFFSYKCGAIFFQTTSFWLGLMHVSELHHDKTITFIPEAKTFGHFFHMDNDHRKLLMH